MNDNDDLVPLFNSYTEVLKATYGDFYVAEMIEAQNAENRCLSSEVTFNFHWPLQNKNIWLDKLIFSRLRDWLWALWRLRLMWTSICWTSASNCGHSTASVNRTLMTFWTRLRKSHQLKRIWKPKAFIRSMKSLLFRINWVNYLLMMISEFIEFK